MTPSMIAAWVILSVIVAVLAKDRRLGFWGGLVCALILSPVICLLILIITKDKKPKAPAE